jgi:hypothetical protein
VLLFVSAIKLICEIALLALAGRWVLGILAGQGKEQNFFYQTLDVLAKPFIKAARAISPKSVIDRHVPLVAFLVLAFIWVVALLEKLSICKTIGMELCK